MVEGKFKSIRKVDNNGNTRQSWKIHQATGPQEGPESILFNQRISNTLAQEAAGLMGSSGVANFCRSCHYSSELPGSKEDHRILDPGMMKEVEGVALSYLKQSGCDDHNEQQGQRGSQGEPTLRYYDYCNSSHVLLYSRSSEQGLQPTSGFPEASSECSKYRQWWICGAEFLRL